MGVPKRVHSREAHDSVSSGTLRVCLLSDSRFRATFPPKHPLGLFHGRSSFQHGLLLVMVGREHQAVRRLVVHVRRHGRSPARCQWHPTRPCPEARRYADDERHEDTQGEDFDVGSEGGPRREPDFSEGVLVHVRRQHTGGRYDVEDGEDAYSNHDEFEFVRLGSVGQAVSRTYHGHKAPEEEAGADQKVSAGRQHNEAEQSVAVLVSHEAGARQFIGVHHPHHQYYDRLDGGEHPGEEMEGCHMFLHPLVAPAKSGGQEPSDGEHDPPSSACHSEIVEQHEHRRAVDVVHAFLDEDGHFVLAIQVAGHARAAQKQTNEVGNAVDVVAAAKVDDASLGVVEAARIHEEGTQSKKSRREAKAGPKAGPDLCETLVFLREQDVPVAKVSAPFRAVDVKEVAVAVVVRVA